MMHSTLVGRSCSKCLPVASRGATRSNTRVSAGMQDMLKQMQSDPAMAAKLKAVQEQMSKPEVQQQMQQMQSVMANPQLQARMQELRSDPEFADFWKDIQAGGMQAMMKYYNDPQFLAKLSSKVGSAMGPVGEGAAPAAAMAPPEAPEVKDLLDAARYGDLEAVEDFIAIGKDVKMADKEGRTPLHFAAGFDHAEIARMLIAEGANLEACDSKGNTPLHYACGYGRVELVSLLLEAGANKAAQNSTGSTPYKLGTADARNPVSQDADLVAKLKI